MCAFVRRNCPARRDHRETVAIVPKPPRRAYRARRNALCVSLPPDCVIWAEDLLGGVMGPVVP
eukprot:2074354-Prymnesium_polylepis.1